jgi:lipopolysaccharide/colanic/teichoic acid biosynthesis glycosyltransferase
MFDHDDSSLSITKILEQRRSQLIIKRGFDVILSFIGLVCLLPVFLVIGLIVKISTGGPVLFKQIRIGKDGKEFTIFKFRTMIADAENKGLQLTIGKDRRITKIGSILRKTKFDEFPQLINVLIGDMSFVGPRPEVPKYVAMYNNDQRNILKVKPGITDLASIMYRNEGALLAKSAEPEKVYIEEIIPAKISLNHQYLRNISVINDLKIIIKTVLSLFIRNK